MPAKSAKPAKKMLPEHVKMAATIGPASSSRAVLDGLLREGVDCIRINASHVNPEDLHIWVKKIRQSAKRVGRDVAIAVDLPGIKFRIGELSERMILREGETVIFGRPGDGRIPVNLSKLGKYVKKGSDIFLRDGFMRLRVEKVGKEEIVCTVLRDGELVSRSGINLPGVAIDETIPTPLDRKHIAAALELDIDIFALSFVRSAAEVKRARKLTNGIPLVAKIERPEAVENIEEIEESRMGSWWRVATSQLRLSRRCCRSCRSESLLRATALASLSSLRPRCSRPWCTTHVRLVRS